MPALPVRSPTGQTGISVVGGENLFYLASRYLGSADQWWRIANLNAFPGQAPDFIVDASSLPTSGILLIPQSNPNANTP